MIHGFTSTPDSFRHLAHRLSNNLGWEIHAPLLPGHGLTYDQLDHITSQKWITFAEKEFEDLSQKFSKVHLVGLSMGGTLCAHLATKYPKQVHSLILFSPAMYVRGFWSRVFLPIVRLMPKSILKKWIVQKPYGITTEPISYHRYSILSVTEFDNVCKTVKKEFQTNLPCLIFAPVNDMTIHPKSAKWFLSHTSSTKSRLVDLYQSPHVVFLGKDNEKIDTEVETFLKSI